MRKAMRKARDEQGFSLVELPVVVIGILAGVAVSIYLNQRKSAWRSSVQNDVHNAQVAIATAMTKLKDGEKLTMKTNDSSATCSDKGCTFTQSGDTISGTPVTVAKDNTIKVTISYSNMNGGDSYIIDGGNSSLGDFEYKYESITGAMEWHPHKP